MPLLGCSAGNAVSSCRLGDLVGPLCTLSNIQSGYDTVTTVYLESLDSLGNRLPHAESVSIEIKYANGTVQVHGTSDGLIKIPLVHKECANNPEVRLIRRAGDSAGVRVVEYTLGISQQDRPVRTVLVDNMRRQNGDGYTVFYEQGCEKAADMAVHEMATLKALIASLCEVAPPHIGVVIVNEGGNYYTPSLSITFPLWTFSQSDIVQPVSGRGMPILAHEWTEETINWAMRTSYDTIRQCDPRTRFIIDGIAEYVAFKAYGQLTGSGADRLVEARARGIKTVDLRDFTAEDWSRDVLAVSYPVSFCFWHDIADRFGESAIRDVLREWRQADCSDLESAIHAIQTATNDTSIAQRIASMDISNCIMLLQRVTPPNKAHTDAGASHIYVHVTPTRKVVTHPR